MPLNKPIEKYGRRGKVGTPNEDLIVGIPYHIKALINARNEYGLEVQVGEKFMIVPVLTNEVEGVRKLRRVKKYMAFTEKSGLPNEFEIDFETYLKSIVYGKIHQILDMDERELEKEVYDSIPNIEKINQILEVARS